MTSSVNNYFPILLVKSQKSTTRNIYKREQASLELLTLPQYNMGTIPFQIPHFNFRPTLPDHLKQE